MIGKQHGHALLFCVFEAERLQLKNSVPERAVSNGRLPHMPSAPVQFVQLHIAPPARTAQVGPVLLFQKLIGTTLPGCMAALAGREGYKKYSWNVLRRCHFF